MSSSRRTGGEINILAMLDGKTPGALSRRLLGLPRAFWYALAAITVCILVAALAWLARTPASTRGADSDTATFQPLPPIPTAAPMPMPTVPDAPASAPGGMPGATIIDGPVASAPTVAPAPTVLPPPSIPTAPTPIPSLSSHDAAAPTASRLPMESAPAARTHAPSSMHPPAQAAVRATTGERKPAAPHASVSRSDAPSRAKRQASAAKPTAPAALDTDVALISAIIQHMNAHPDPAGAEADATPSCAKPGCHTRLPNRQ